VKYAAIFAGYGKVRSAGFAITSKNKFEISRLFYSLFLALLIL
jgi:hypothetical protein